MTNNISSILAVVDLKEQNLTREQLEQTVETYILGGVHIEAVQMGDKIVLVGKRQREVVH